MLHWYRLLWIIIVLLSLLLFKLICIRWITVVDIKFFLMFRKFLVLKKHVSYSNMLNLTSQAEELNGCTFALTYEVGISLRQSLVTFETLRFLYWRFSIEECDLICSFHWYIQNVGINCQLEWSLLTYSQLNLSVRLK